jgi:hypothetical protein
MWWHLALILAASIAFETAFLHHGLNVYDEGWPLYAAMQLHAGGVLFDDVFFVFPPGHLLAAWLGYAIDPPGIVFARGIYAGFNVALCAAMYFLGRRFLPAQFALQAALLLAIAAPGAHLWQYHFGYRYLVFSVLALIAFAERLRTGELRWMFASGLLTGLALCFRLTPAFSAAVAIGVGVLLADRSPRRWLRDWGGFAAGLLSAVAPVVVWFALDVGLASLWREIVVRPVAMTDLQSLEVPELLVPASWTRLEISKLFTAVQFRAWGVLYCSYAIVLGLRWLRALRTGRTFDPVLLTVVVVWGGSFFLRAFGRADIGHLESALPPACLLLAHLCYSLLPARCSNPAPGSIAPRIAVAGVIVATLSAWIFLFETDRRLTLDRRGDFPIEVLSGRVSLAERWRAAGVDERVMTLIEHTRAGDSILDLSAAPIYHVLAERRGPGLFDVVVPGTFLDDAEERRFVERLEADPPAVVVVASKPFDEMRARAVSATAPRVAEWLRTHYRVDRVKGDYKLWVPREDQHPAR